MFGVHVWNMHSGAYGQAEETIGSPGTTCYECWEPKEQEGLLAAELPLSSSICYSSSVELMQLAAAMPGFRVLDRLCPWNNPVKTWYRILWMWPRIASILLSISDCLGFSLICSWFDFIVTQISVFILHFPWHFFWGSHGILVCGLLFYDFVVNVDFIK